MKDYLLKLLERCAPENGFAQNAIDLAISQGRIQLTYDLEQDERLVMEQYDAIIENVRVSPGTLLVRFYKSIGFLAAIQQQPIPKPTTHVCTEERKAA